MDRINEIQARLAEINAAIDTATGEALAALETESRTLLEELNGLQQTAQARQALRQQIAAGAGTPSPIAPQNQNPQTEAERNATAFMQSRHMGIGAEQARSVLISSGNLATPTEVSGINDIPGAKVSSIIDMVKVVNCVGMGTHRVAYVDADAAAAAEQTEGENAVEAALQSYKYVDIKPTSVAVVDYISKQAKKQTPLQYAAKVREQALVALRKKAAAVVTGALKASELNYKLKLTAGKIDDKTLRTIALAYGGDESVIGGAVLFLNKADLIAFGDVRGTNEKKAVYEITPDAANPNTGVIRDGGLSVRYCLNSNLTGLATAEADAPAMFYGNPQALELDLFSDYEVNVSNDYAFIKLMDTILGDVELGADVTVKHGFVAVTK